MTGAGFYRGALACAQFPFRVFDLQGADGRVAHGKVVPFLAIVCWTLILGAIGLLTRTYPPTAAIIAILTVSFLNTKLFHDFLGSWKGTSSDAVSFAHTESRAVVDETRRTLAYTEAGEPAHSLPAQPDARTPAGGE